MSSNTNMFFTHWEVRVEKSFAQGLDHTDRDLVPAFKTESKVFLYTDRRRPIFTLKCLVYD